MTEFLHSVRSRKSPAALIDIPTKPHSQQPIFMNGLPIQCKSHALADSSAASGCIVCLCRARPNQYNDCYCFVWVENLE